MDRVSDYRLEPPADPPDVGLCAGCGGEIFEDEEYASDGELLIHKDRECLAEWAAEWFGIRSSELR